MPEMSGAENPKFSRAELLSTAGRLFAGVPYLNGPMPVNCDLFTGAVSLAGMVPLEVEQAIKAEFDRAREHENQRLNQKQAEWQQRSVGKMISDLLKRQGYFDVVGTYEPKPDVSEVMVYSRKLSGSLPLGEGWPPLVTSIEQSHLNGNLTIAGKEFALDPTDSLLRVRLDYPLSDGTRIDLGVTHTLYPYRDEIETKTQVVFGDYWSGVPHQPFSEEPTDASVYMDKAMEMFINGQGYISSI